LTLDLRDCFLGIPCLCGAPVVLAKTTLRFVQPKLVNVLVVSGILALGLTVERLNWIVNVQNLALLRRFVT
jgi:hypothetical protein